MAKYRHLSNAPITEALIDLRVALPPDSLPTLKALSGRISGKFPNQKEIHHGELTFRLGGSERPAGQFKQGGLGYISWTIDETKKVQFRGDGFTFNKPKPYENWETMRDEARGLWAIYSEAIPPSVTINRVALRFINHIEIPAGSLIGDYIANPPSIPEGLPQSMVEYLNRLVLFHPGIPATAIITQNMPASQKGASSGRLLLDIDIIKEQAHATERDAWELLEKFREFKNEIFFQSITERTAEIYK